MKVKLSKKENGFLQLLNLHFDLSRIKVWTGAYRVGTRAEMMQDGKLGKFSNTQEEERPSSGYWEQFRESWTRVKTQPGPGGLA